MMFINHRLVVVLNMNPYKYVDLLHVILKMIFCMTNIKYKLRKFISKQNSLIECIWDSLSPLSEDIIDALRLSVVLHLQLEQKTEETSFVSVFAVSCSAEQPDERLLFTYNVVITDHFLHLRAGVELVHELENKYKQLKMSLVFNKKLGSLYGFN